MHAPKTTIADIILLSGVDPGGRGGRLPPPNKKYTWARVSFHPLKALAELQKIAPRMYHKSHFEIQNQKKFWRGGCASGEGTPHTHSLGASIAPPTNIFGLTLLILLPVSMKKSSQQVN